MQLIDKEAYQQRLLEIMYSSVLDNMIDSSIYKDDDCAKSAIRYGICLASLFTCDCATVQVKPTKCGQWVYVDTVAGIRYHRCTNCTDNTPIATEEEIKWWKFCPNCGAKMMIYRLADTEQKEETLND